jgi:hypothetical protein
LRHLLVAEQGAFFRRRKIHCEAGRADRALRTSSVK